MFRYTKIAMFIIASVLFGCAYAHAHGNNAGDFSNGGAQHQNQSYDCNHQNYGYQSRQYTVTVQRDWRNNGYNNRQNNTYADRDDHGGYPTWQQNGGWHDWRPAGGNQWHDWHPDNQPGYQDMSYQAWNQPFPGVTIYFSTQNDYHGYGW